MNIEAMPLFFFFYFKVFWNMRKTIAFLKNFGIDYIYNR